jgi:hypothetical protein
MIFRALIGLILLLCTASLAGAQDVVTVRSGAQKDYSRLAFTAPSDVWTLRQSGRQATFEIEDWVGEFNLSNVFDRLPRTRLLSLQAQSDETNSALNLSLGCSCEVRATLEDGMIILDIYDPETNDQLSIADNVTEVPQTPSSDLPKRRPERSQERASVAQVQEPLSQGHGAGRSEPEDLTQWLVQQLEAAESAGLIEQAEVPAIETDTQMDTPEVTSKASDQEPAPELEPEIAAGSELENLTRRLDRAVTALPENEVDFTGSLRISRPDNAIAQAPANTVDKPAPQSQAQQYENCISDTELDLASWSDGNDVNAQIVEMRQALLEEFDIPDPGIVRNLVRLYVTNGLGVEAIDILSEFGSELSDQAVLHDIAKIVEGQKIDSDGPIAIGANCPGYHALWRTAGIDVGEDQPVSDTEDLLNAFSSLPISTRRLLEPRLITSLLNRNQIEDARRVFDLVDRASGDHGDAHTLMRARFYELEGIFEKAKSEYVKMIVGNSVLRAEAMMHLVAGMIERDDPIDPGLMEMLESEAFRMRGLPIGRMLRKLEVYARASDDSLSAALDTLDAAIAENPDQKPRYIDVANDILTDARLNKDQPDALVAAIFQHRHIVDADGITLKTRLKLASDMIEASLPQVALSLLSAVSESGDPQLLRLRSEAYLNSAKPNEAEAIAGRDTTENLSLISAQALTSKEDYVAAFNALESAGTNADISMFAWRASAWEVALANDSEEIQELARFMIDRERSDESVGGAFMTTGSAFEVSPSQSLEVEGTLAKSRSVISRTMETREILTRSLEAF